MNTREEIATRLLASIFSGSASTPLRPADVEPFRQQIRDSVHNAVALTDMLIKELGRTKTNEST
jgi:hypothetical protein